MISRQQKLSKLAFRFGLLGLLGLVLGVTVATLSFTDVDGHGFSFFNYSVSELGHYGHSAGAVLLNGGLFFGGLSLVLFCLFAMQISDSPWLVPCFLLLGGSFLSLAVVGLFPINVYHLHNKAMHCFYYFGFSSSLTYLFYSAFAKRRFASLGSIFWAFLTWVSFTLSLLLAHLDIGIAVNGKPFYQEMVMAQPRPELWWPALIEWISVGLFVLWVFSLVWSQRESKA